jgi:hypothetical protein
MRIDNEFEGGNIQVLEVEGDTVRLAVELRDTEGDWFYWAFRVRGAQGRTLTFDFGDKAYVGYFGAAVSRDNYTWHWSESASEDYQRFSHTFAPDEDEVYFCHNMRFGIDRFTALAAELDLPLERLGVSRKGRVIPFVQFGEGEKTLLLTSRHHACESTGSYVMEGMLRELRPNPIPGWTVVAVPFMDLDGVVDGDQGKNRRPHDHNRDYLGEPLYETVRWAKALGESRQVVYDLDLHSPWHFGGRNDVCFIVRKGEECRATQARFGELMERRVGEVPGALRYETKDDLDSGVEWNSGVALAASGVVFWNKQPSVRLAVSIETPYFGTPDNRVTQESLVLFGTGIGRAVRDAAAEGL